jgi:transposase
MKYIALDCHKQYDHATMIDSDTGEIKHKKLAHYEDEYKEFIGERSGTKLVLESCRDWSRSYELSKDLVEEIILAHPLKVKAIASAKIKTDKIDSQILAKLLMADLIPQAHLRTGENRVKQRVIRHRAFMVVMRTRVKSRIHDIVDSQLLPAEVLKKKPIDLFSKKGMKWLLSLKWAQEDDVRMVDSHLRMMEVINQEISTTNEMIKEIYLQDVDAQLLSTIPGIGITLATLISTETDGIERFRSPSKLCSYAGLVPSTHSSGGKTYHGKITAEGNRWLRWALVEAAVPASYADADVKNRLDKLREKKKGNVAKTATARWLLKVVYHVLKERRPYIEAYHQHEEVGAAL